MKSFLEGKKSVASTSVNASRPSALKQIPGTARAQAAAPAHAHSIEVVKEGNKITRLVITCTCGERTEVDCIYPVGA